MVPYQPQVIQQPDNSQLILELIKQLKTNENQELGNKIQSLTDAVLNKNFPQTTQNQELENKIQSLTDGNESKTNVPDQTNISKQIDKLTQTLINRDKVKNKKYKLEIMN